MGSDNGYAPAVGARPSGGHRETHPSARKRVPLSFPNTVDSRITGGVDPPYRVGAVRAKTHTGRGAGEIGTVKPPGPAGHYHFVTGGSGVFG
jgi:hypothetical protein